MKRFLAMVFAVGLGLTLATAASAETAGQKVDRGVEKTKDAGETVKDKSKSTAETVKDKTKDAAETVKDKTESAVDKVKDKTRDMKDRITGKKSEGAEDHHRTSSTSTAPAMKGTMRSNDVMSMQQALKDKGHDPGPIDGRMGPHTRSALMSYQKAEGLKATGRADAETRAKLGVATSSTRSMTPSASPRTSTMGAPTASDTKGDANVTAPASNPPAASTEQGTTSTKTQKP